MAYDSFRYDGARLVEAEIPVVEEYPLALRVNDREIATLVASPHDLRFLVAGFLRLQGFVSSVDDFLMLSVCSDFGYANVRVRAEIPERLKPILTSGCGTGITFSLPDGSSSIPRVPEVGDIASSSTFAIFDSLGRTADMYRSHGGLHSSASARLDGSLLLHAEDIGRHNTIDRIAGEALLKGIPLQGTVLATSGRVSAEMAAKAAFLGVSVVATRTSPTSMAVRICRDAGITLVGYVRGGKFNVYSRPDRIACEGASG